MLNIARAHDPQVTVQWREGSAQAMPFPDEAFALGDATGLAAEVASAGFADVTAQTASRLLRYDSPEEFAHLSHLHPVGNGLAFPIESQIIIARK